MSPDERLALVAAGAYGIFTHAQALRCGIGRDAIQCRLRSGRWQRLYRGIYRISGVPSTYEQSVLAAVLACGDGARASHTTAGSLYRLDGVERGLLEVTVPRDRRPRVRGVVIHRAPLSGPDVTRLRSIPVTSPVRTLIDLASILSDDDLEDALDDAIRRRRVHPRPLQQRLEQMPRQGRTGAGRLLRLVRTRTTRNVPGSRWESKVRRALVRAGLPEPVRQFEIHDPAGRFVARPDLSYPNVRVYIEYDGGGHALPEQRAHDLARQNALSAIGWRPLLLHDVDLRKPSEAFALLVRKALSA